MPKWYNGTLVKTEDINEQVRLFFVRVNSQEKFDFEPGQFVVMDLPISEKRIGRWRSYSLANTPNDDNLLEFCIVRVPNGGATKYLFDEINVGSELRFKEPSGTFTFLPNLEGTSVLICTGTGVAPYRSILKYIKENNLAFHKIHLIFGTRHKRGILYKDEMEEWTQSHDNFIFDVALSREPYKGYKGYVHDLYMRKYNKNEEGLRFYLCGWQNMIDEAVANLVLKKGFKPNQIMYELYG